LETLRSPLSIREISRRTLLSRMGLAGVALGFGSWPEASSAFGQDQNHETAIESFTGPGQNSHWNSIGPYISEPQKAPLILLTDRPVQLETPREYFRHVFTPNDAFYVRWHLSGIPNAVDLKSWKLQIEGNVKRPVALSLSELTRNFKPVSVAATNQCSGNSRSRLQPRVAGAQWGNGAMGNAMWTGVPLKELLEMAGVKDGSAQVQFQGLETGPGPGGFPSNLFLKSLDLSNEVIDECIVAYLMNGEPLPMLNGFPVRLVVPGYFATYWTKCLTWIRVLSAADENFWMKTGYRIPDTPRGSTTPEAMKTGNVKNIPISRFPVRSFIVTPDGNSKLISGVPIRLSGIAFSGYGRIARVELSEDDGKTWNPTKVDEDYGPYSFRVWNSTWTPKSAGRYSLRVRATDDKNNVQLDEPVWNPGGYLWNRIERQEYVVGESS
jgi:DMSO/TMAO reductase YedYZ molybdopterin-dependent catalytic subunit